MQPKQTHLLIVDDERSSVSVLCSLLENFVNLHFASNAAEAFEIIENQHLDMVLLDVDLPDMSGFDTCRQIKQTEGLIDTPVIFLSGYGDLIFEIQAFESGAIDYVTKPVSPVRLMLRINAHLNLKLPIPGV